MRKPRHKVTDEDIRYVLENVNKVPTKEIAKTLDMSVTTVGDIANRFGIRLTKYYPSTREKWIDDYIIEHYPNTSSKEISKVVGMGAWSVDRLAKKLGISHSEAYYKQNDISGQRFGYLLVLEYGKFNGSKTSICKCVCDCGNIHFVDKGKLISGSTKSCGCKQHEIKHGECKSSLYMVYYAMRGRCNCPNNRGYRNYGGRGIKICSEWQKGYKYFREWALNNGYQEGLTIDRINNDGDYCPENCRWTTMLVQNNNRRRNRRITYLGKTQTIAQWARELNINDAALRERVKKGTFPPKDNQ